MRRIVVRVATLIAAGALLPVGVLATATEGQAAPDGSSVSQSKSVPARGRVNLGTPRTVNVASLPSAPTPFGGINRNLGALRLDGLVGPVARRAVSKVGVASVTPSVTQPTHIVQNFVGTDATQSSCGCQPPDSNGAVSKGQIVEMDNLSLQVWNKSSPTTLLKRVGLNAFFNTGDSLSDPRVLYDNAWNRFVFFVTIVPPSATSTPAIWLAVSQSSNATGNWWIYRPSFSGGLYPAGTLLDYPMVGMDADSIVLSSNNFQRGSGGGFSYVDTAVLSFAKQRLYGGLGFSVPAFGVNFSAHPAFVEGIPQNQEGREYIVASQVPYGGHGFDVYYMTNSSRPDLTAVTFAGSVADPTFTFGPPNCAPQPGGGNCLDALDGRLQAAPRQLNGNLWWARAVGFPEIEYGVINGSSLAATDAVAYVAGSSNDWNPSIGVSDAGGGQQYVFLNWAYDDPGTGTQVSTRVAGLGAGDGVQNLIGLGTRLGTGGHGNDFRFGDYSSVSIDPSASATCPAGRRALVVNEQFNSAGNWQLRDARIGFC